MAIWDGHVAMGEEHAATGVGQTDVGGGAVARDKAFSEWVPLLPGTSELAPSRG